MSCWEKTREPSDWHVWTRMPWRIRISWYWDACEVLKWSADRVTDSFLGPYAPPVSAVMTEPLPGVETWRTCSKGPFHHSVYMRTSPDQAAEIIEMLAQDWISRIEGEFEFPAPPPACMQVWRHPEYGDRLVVRVDAQGCAYMPGHIDDDKLDQWLTWPPTDAELVAGPGAPWAPKRS